MGPSPAPTSNPTPYPTSNPTKKPSDSPIVPGNPTFAPSTNTGAPTPSPTTNPTKNPTKDPSQSPTLIPSNNPTNNPLTPGSPTISPSQKTENPTRTPSTYPTKNPVLISVTDNPTYGRIRSPTQSPSNNPTETICCDLNDRTPDQTEACCPDGTWVQSIGDGKTFNCDGVFIVSGSQNALFGSVCPTPFPTKSPTTTKSPTYPTTIAPSTFAPTPKNINAISPTSAPTENAGEVIEDNQSKNDLDDDGDIGISIIGNNDYLFYIIIGVMGCCICGIIAWFLACKRRKNKKETVEKMGELRRIKSDTPMTLMSALPMTPTMTLNETEKEPMKTDDAIIVSVDHEKSATLPSSDDDDGDGEADGMYLGIKTKQDAEYDNVPKLPDDDLLDEDDGGVDDDLYVSDNDGMVTPISPNEGDEETKGFG